MRLEKQPTLAWVIALATVITTVACLAGVIKTSMLAPVVSANETPVNSEKNTADLSTYIALHQTTSGIRTQYLRTYPTFPF